MVITAKKLRALALALPAAEEHPHFERPSFRVKGKIFAVLHEREGRVVLKLSIPDQSFALSSHPDVAEACAGAWGLQGWTSFRMKGLPLAVFQSLLHAAWLQVAPKNLSHPSLRRTP